MSNLDKRSMKWSDVSFKVEQHKIYGQLRDLPKMIQKNLTLNEIANRLEFEGFECLQSKHFESNMKRIYIEMAKGSFDIAKGEEDFKGLYKEVFEPLYGLVHLLDFVFIDSRAIQILFPLELLNKFIEFRYFRYGYWLYDELLKIRSVMMNILLQFHLSSDAKFHLRIDTHNIPFMDPLLRIHIRQTNRLDKVLQQKYFISSFDLKKLIYKSLDTYFPNVTWRYIGGSVYINHQIFNLIKSLFELGLWGYSDLIELLEALTTSIENLAKLEKASINEVKKGVLNTHVPFMLYLADYFQRCRNEIAEICVHIITLVNDHALEEALPWNPNYKNTPSKLESSLENIFFNDLRKSSIVYSLVTNYLMLEGRIEKNFPKDLIDEKAQKLLVDSLARSHAKLQTLINDLFEIITYETNDLFISSNSLTHQTTFDILTNPQDDCVDYITEAHFYRRALHSLFEELKMVDSLIDLEARAKSDLLLRILSLLEASIDEKTSLGKSELFAVALGINNVHVILLAITNLVDQYLTDPKQSWLSEECLVAPIMVIVKSTNNAACQSIMLSRVGWELFNRLVQRRPLLSVMAIERIFSQSSEIFKGRLGLFKTFLGMYQKIAQEVGTFLFPSGKLKEDLFRQLRTNEQAENYSLMASKILSMILLNQFFFNIIKSKVATPGNLRNYGAHFQTLIDELFAEGLLKQILLDPDFVKVEFASFDDKLFSSLDPQNIVYFANTTFRPDELRSLVFELAYSTLKLFAKSTARLNYGHFSDRIKSVLSLSNCHDRTSHLASLETGLDIKRLLLKLLTNLFIFKNNATIAANDEEEPTLIRNSTTLDSFFCSEADSKVIMHFLESEFNFLDEWAKQHYDNTSTSVKLAANDYLFEGLFPAVYKYAKGVLSVMTYSYADSNKSKSLTHELNVGFETLMLGFERYCRNVQARYGANIISAELFEFTSTLQVAFEPDLLSPSITNQNSQPNWLPMSIMRDLEPDELLFPELRDLRDKLRAICKLIRQVCPLDKLAYIDKYDRPTVLKKRRPHNESKQRSSVSSRKQARVIHSNDEDAMLHLAYESAYDQFHAVCEAYKAKKTQWLSKSKEGNSFYRYLDEHDAGMKRFINYWMQYITREFNKKPLEIVLEFDHFDSKPESKSYFYLKKMFEDDLPMSLISFLETIFKTVPKCKKAFFEDIEQNEDRMLLIQAMFGFHKELTKFLFFKTFHDDDYQVLNGNFMLLNQVLITFADKKNSVFKDFVASCKTSVQDSIVYSIKQSVEFILGQMEEVYHKRQSFILMVERPEIMHIVICLIQLLAELCSGPHLPCQGAIYSNAIDKFIIPILRTVDDVNSSFYHLKFEIINYLSEMIEVVDYQAEFNKQARDLITGDNFSYKNMNETVRQFMADNIKATDIELQIIKMIKKLFIHVLIMNDDKFKKRLIATIKSDLETQRAELKARFEKQGLFLRTSNANKRLAENLYNYKDDSRMQIEQELINIDLKISKIERLADSESRYEDSSAIILSDMERNIRLSSPWNLIEYYKMYPLFSDHLLLKTCIQLQLILTSLSDSSESFQTVTQNRMNLMYAYYGSKVPAEVRQKIDATKILRLREEDAPEDVVIFQFLWMITKRIEVRLPTDDDQIVTKVMHFQLHPTCLFLTRDTKDNMINSIHPDDLVDTVIDSYEALKIEMEENRRNFMRSKILYYLTLHDSLTKQKYIVWYLSLIMNLMLVFSMRTDNREDTYYFVFGELTFVVFSLVIAFLSFVLLSLWYSGRYQQLVHANRTKYIKMIGLRNFALYDYYQVYVMKSILSKKTPLQCLLHILFSMLGAFVHPFFHTLHLLLIYLMSDTAYYVISSITTHFSQLGITLLMAVFFIYSMAFITFTNYSHNWNNEVDNDGTIPVCKNMWECLPHVINMGFRFGGGIADAQIPTDAYVNVWAFVAKILFDLTFFMLINVISLNIIFGIIIDTFASMRDSREEKLKAYRTKCAVCGEGRDIMERNGETHAYHTMFKHNVFKYLYFQVYLDYKDPHEFTAVENSLYEHVILHRNTDWFPKSQFEDEAIRIEQHKMSNQIGKILDFINSMKQERDAPLAR